MIITNDEIRVNGDIVPVQGSSSQIEYVATQDQDTFNANYTPGFVNVFVNGLQIQSDLFTATNGTSITLDSQLNAGDVVIIEGYGNYNVANVYTQAEVDQSIQTLNSSIDLKAPLDSPSFTGNVGIGNGNPSDRLDVLGQGRFHRSYSYGEDNYALKLTSNYGSGQSSYISNISVNNRMELSSGGYYYGSSSYQLTDGATGLGALSIGEDGTLSYKNTSGVTADSLVNPIERMRIDSSGNVLINTTNSGGYSNRLVVQDATGGATEPSVMTYVNSTGTEKHGIGTSSSQFNLVCEGYNNSMVFHTGAAGAATESMRIDSTGRVTAPNQPSFVAVDNRGAGQTSAANTNISQYFTTAVTNIGNCYNTGTGHFTAPVSGMYCFGWNFFTAGIGADTVSRNGLHINGDGNGFISMGDRAASASQGSCIVYLNQNDYICLGTQGGNYTAYWYSSNQHSRFWGYLIG
jgi:hypothetical protein